MHGDLVKYVVLRVTVRTNLRCNKVALEVGKSVVRVTVHLYEMRTKRCRQNWLYYGYLSSSLSFSTSSRDASLCFLQYIHHSDKQKTSRTAMEATQPARNDGTAPYWWIIAPPIIAPRPPPSPQYTP